MTYSKKPHPVAALLGLALASAIPGAALAATATVSVLTPLNQYGGYPDTPLFNDGSGNLIGATWYAMVHGRYSNGTVFSVAPDGTPTRLHAFAISDGAPGGPLVRTSDGSIYGVTPDGGTNGHGSVYRIAADGTFSVLYSFSTPSAKTFQNADGFDPESLVLGSDGALYGTARSGGSSDLGTIFRVTTDGQFSVLYTFTPAATSGVAANQPCSLISGADGALYGTTLRNNTQPYGSVFRITTDGQFSLLQTLTNQGTDQCPTLMQGRDGNFYGTSMSYYSSSNATTYSGLVYKMSPAGKMTPLHVFQPLQSGYYNFDGSTPTGVIEASDGKLYGATNGGGKYALGTLFQLGTDGSFTKLYDFTTKLDGYPSGHPTVNIVQGTDGALYGTTAGPYGVTTRPAIFKAVISN